MPAKVIDSPTVPAPVLLGTLTCGDHFSFPDDHEAVFIFLGSYGAYDSTKKYFTFCSCVRVKTRFDFPLAFTVRLNDTPVMKRSGLRTVIEFEG